ncbi:MAG TPA: tetratricopeptide repeat protein [Bryobacteraceae bacterium]|nr:tetratricopeptide repeat protein [Bryobacteraceae bacterium]
MKRAREPWFWIYGGTVVVLLLAGVIFTWQAMDSQREPGVRNVAGAVPTALGKTSPVRYQLLARIEPAPPPEMPQGTEKALEAYNRRDYVTAIERFNSVLGTHPDSAEARFYLAICHLLTKDTGTGTAELQHVIAVGNTPYLDQAHFYLAKVLLGRGDVAGARRELRDAMAVHGDFEKRAEVLLSELR